MDAAMAGTMAAIIAADTAAGNIRQMHAGLDPAFAGKVPIQ